MKTVMVTGTAGFIGSQVSHQLLDSGVSVIGVDSLNDYYDVRLKEWRLERLRSREGFHFYRADIEHREVLKRVFERHTIDAVINEAARAGVRYSLENPFVYLSTNALGELNLLELCREFKVPKFILSSSSSLYAGQAQPFTEDLPVNQPLSPYAATKKAAEALAYTYHHLYDIDIVVLRYFTVYGPAGRPDMSPFRFIKWIKQDIPLEVFGDGSQRRDFTFVDDIARGTISALQLSGYEIVNLGNNQPAPLSGMIALIEKYTGKKARYTYREFHKADMQATWADISKAKRLLGWEPEIGLDEGIRRTVAWTEENWEWIKDMPV